MKLVSGLPAAFAAEQRAMVGELGHDDVSALGSAMVVWDGEVMWEQWYE